MLQGIPYDELRAFRPAANFASDTSAAAATKTSQLNFRMMEEVVEQLVIASFVHVDRLPHRLRQWPVREVRPQGLNVLQAPDRHRPGLGLQVQPHRAVRFA